MRHGAPLATALILLLTLAALPTGTVAQTGETTDEPARLFTAFCEQVRCVLDASPAHLPDTEITTYEWDLGDGTTADGELVNHIYEAAGTYNVTLTVHGEDGSTLTETRDITVHADRNGNDPAQVPWAALALGLLTLLLGLAAARMI